jgi:hypothetical protein
MLISLDSVSQNQYGYGSIEDSTILELVTVFKSIDGQYLTEEKLDAFYNRTEDLNYLDSTVLVIINEFQKDGINSYEKGVSFFLEKNLFSELTNKMIEIEIDYSAVYSDQRMKSTTSLTIDIHTKDKNWIESLYTLHFYISKGKITAIDIMIGFPIN